MGKTALLFAGQGAQYPGMGRELYETSAAARTVFDAGEAIRPGILELCFAGEKETLSRTEHTQPCLFLTDLAAASALTEAGVGADGVAGFSLGEIAALAFTEVLSFADAFRLVILRGERMAEAARTHPGGMAAILRLPDEIVETLAQGFSSVRPVNYNCPGQITCAGSKDELALFCEAARQAGGRAVQLAVSGAFHTPDMAEASDALAERLSELTVSAPCMPLWANLTARPYPSDADEIRRLVAAQAQNSVRWADTLRRMQADGYDTFIEVGPGKTLSGFTAKTLNGVKIANVSDRASLEAALSVLR